MNSERRWPTGTASPEDILEVVEDAINGKFATALLEENRKKFVKAGEIGFDAVREIKIGRMY
jgi:hypothetical protein